MIVKDLWSKATKNASAKHGPRVEGTKQPRMLAQSGASLKRHEGTYIKHIHGKISMVLTLLTEVNSKQNLLVMGNQRKLV